MVKYNTKKESAKPSEINFVGEKAYKMEAKEELISTVMTTFLHDGYYETEKETVDRITNLLKEVDPLFAAKLAIYVRNEGNLRSVSHLIAAEIAKYVTGSEWGKRFYEKIVVRPDDMSEIVAAYANINGMGQNEINKIPNSIKKGFKKALEKLDPYQLDKYKMKKRSVSMVDLIRLFHPKSNEKNEEAYRRLIKDESLDDLYTSKILEKEMTKAGQETKDKGKEEQEEAKHDAIVKVLSNIKGMPIMNLLRNLRNIILYAPDMVDEACEQLRIKEKIINSRLLPFRFATAYQEIEKMEYDGKEKATTSIAFESDVNSKKTSRLVFEDCKHKVMDAVEDALQYSVENIPELEGNVAVLVDHSGSVRGDMGGSSRVSAFSKTNTAMIGNLFGCMMAYRQNNVYMGLFGDRLVNVVMSRDKKLLDFNNETFDMGARCGVGTETGIYEFMRNCIKEKKKVDNVVVFSDCQIGSDRCGFTPWYGMVCGDKGEHFHELFKEFKKINPKCDWIVVNLHQYGGTSVFNQTDRILNIAGWSDKIFDMIKSQCVGWDEIIRRIEAIEI